MSHHDASEEFVNLFDVELEESVGKEAPEHLSRTEAKERELKEIQGLEHRLGKTFEKLRDARSDPSLKRVLRRNVRRMELLAIIADAIRQQLKDLKAIDDLHAKRAKHPKAPASEYEEVIGVKERDIAHLQEEILSARAQFRDPHVVSAVNPPSPVLAVRNKMPIDLDQLSAVTSKLDLGSPTAARRTGSLPADELVASAQGPAPVTPSRTAAERPPHEAVEVTVPDSGDADALRTFLLEPLPKHSMLTLDIERRRHAFSSDFVVRDTKSGKVIMVVVKKASLGSVHRVYQANRKGGSGLDGDGDKGQMVAEMTAGIGKDEHVVTSMRPGSTSGGKGDRDEEIALVHQKVDHSDIGEHEYGVTITTVLPQPDLDQEARDRVVADIKGTYARRDYDLLAVLNNRRAVWVPAMNQLILSYHSSRITGAGISSKKNFQLSSRLAPAHVLLEFGKIADDRFELNVQNPLSPVAAVCSVMCAFK